MKYIATEKFKELGIENSYQGLSVEQWQEFRRGNVVELKEVPGHLIEGDYIKIKNEVTKKSGVTKNGY